MNFNYVECFGERRCVKLKLYIFMDIVICKHTPFLFDVLKFIFAHVKTGVWVIHSELRLVTGLMVWC